MCPEENGTAEGVERLPDESLRQAVDAVVDVVLRLDSEGRIRTASGDTLSVLGYRPGNLGGTPIVELYPGEGIETADGFRATLLDTDTRGLTLPVERADGTVRTVSASVVSGSEGPVCLLTARGGPADRGGVDPLDDIPDPAFVLDTDGRFTRVNSALLSRTGHERAAVVGRDPGEILPGCPDTVDAPVAFETPLPDGSTVEGRLTPLAGPDERYVGAVGVLRVEDRGLDALKTSVGRLLDHGGHELVCGEHEPVRERPTDGTDEAALPALAEWTRLAARPVEVDLGTTIEAAAERVRDAHPEATVAVETPATTVDAHPEIGRAVEELLRNALAPPDSRRVEVTVADGPLVLVEDRAGGLPDPGAAVLRADEPRDDAGGVGLWLVRLLAEGSGGDLVVHRTGEGTVVGLRLGGSDVPAPVGRSRGDIADREEPLATLDRVYESATTPTREHGRTVLLTGEAGIGKTTVVEAFRAALGRRERPPLVATGRCRAGLRRPYDAFEQVFADLPTDRGVAAVLDDAAAFPADDAEARQQYRQTAFADVAARLCAVADDRPVVVVVEDLQRALDSTLDLFEFLVDDIGQRGRPVVLLGTCRATEAPAGRLREQVTDADRGTVLELGPLDRAATAELLADLGAETPAARVHTHTGGNPLFVTELARLPGGIEADTALPETVEETVATRLDAVPESARPTLELGAVAGSEFRFEVLRAASESGTGALVDGVDTLARWGVWNRSTETAGFVHETVREQALDAVDPVRRRGLHDRVASGVETVCADLDACAGRLATHHERAGNRTQAFEWYVRAGEYASEQYAHGDAVTAYERAVELAREAAVDEETLAETHADLADVLVVTGANEAAVTAYERAVRLAREQGATAETLAGMYADLADVRLVTGAVTEATEAVEQGLAVAPEGSPIACRLLDVRTRLLRTRGEFEKARETAREQRDRAVTLDARALEAKAHNHLGDIALRRSRHDRARDHYERCLHHQRDIDEPASEADTLNSLGVLAIIRGEYDIAREHLEESLEIYRRIDDRAGESDALNNLGILAVERGAYDRARRHYEEGIEINRELGARRGEGVCLNSLGNLEAERGAYDDARECLAESLAIHRELGDRHGEARSLHSLGDIALERGAYDRARGHYRQSLDIRPEIDDRRGEAICLSGLGRVAVARGNHDRAQEHLEEALSITRDLDAVKPEITSYRALGRLARHEGEYDRAAEHLQASLSACEVGGDPRDRAETHLEQVRLALARDRPDAARETLDRARDLLAGLEATHADALATLLAGDIAAATGDPDEAKTRWQAALETFEQVDAPRDTLAALERLAETCHEQGDRDRAAAWHDRARTVAADAPDPVRRAYRGFLDGFPP